MLKRLESFCCEESGATAIEYGLIAGIMSIAAVVSLTSMGNSLQALFGLVSNDLTTAVSVSGST